MTPTPCGRYVVFVFELPIIGLPVPISVDLPVVHVAMVPGMS